MSLMEPKEPKTHDELYLDSVFDYQQYWIWTADNGSAELAWNVSFYWGSCYLDNVHDSLFFVRAVR